MCIYVGSAARAPALTLLLFEAFPFFSHRFVSNSAQQTHAENHKHIELNIFHISVTESHHTQSERESSKGDEI